MHRNLESPIMNKKQKSAVLACSYQTAGIIFIVLGCLFVTVGCEKLYSTIGLSDEQIAEQTAQDQEAIENIIETGRTQIYDVVVTILAGTGGILSGLLAKWLKTERKITTAIIQGVETASSDNVKTSIQQKATAAGVENELHTRVSALT